MGGRPGGGINRPGGGGIYDPGQIGGRPWFPNRPNFNNNNTNIINNNTNIINNNWFGNQGGWAVGGWGGPWWGGPGWGGHGWYHGTWTTNNFGLGFSPWGWGVGIQTGNFALAIGRPWFTGGVFHTFPMWAPAPLAGWGLSPWVNTWAYTGFVNPYFVPVQVPVAVEVPVAVPTPVFDYSQPIRVTEAPPEPTIQERALARLDDGRVRFQAGDYTGALASLDEAIRLNPNDPSSHELRALTLFAMGRYDEAAAVLYAVLSAGPGWDWATMISLYPDAETYTTQLRALEAKVKASPDAAAPHFTLAYHYLVAGHSEAAGAQFREVVRLQPKDSLSTRFAAILMPQAEAEARLAAGTPAATAAPAPTPAEAATRTAPTATITPPGEVPLTAPEAEVGEAEEPELEMIPPPAELIGSWRTQPAPDVTITLTLKAEGEFAWEVKTPGQTQIIEGTAAYDPAQAVLALAQQEGPPLAGTIQNLKADGFDFKLAGDVDAPPLPFQKVQP